MKYDRHAKILELIEKHKISTQEELADMLGKHRFEVTQATISRDIRELRLIKVASDDGRYRYAAEVRTEAVMSNKLLTVFTESFVNCDYANNIVVIKTLPGMAQASASAIDALKWTEIVGTIAGDDTIMLVCRAEKIAEGLVNKLNRMAK